MKHSLYIFVFVLLCVSRAGAQLSSPRITVERGWHPWYELKVDPEDPTDLLLCGSRWDARENALSGFVYRSADGGKQWRVVLEDKRSSWVSEQSCAFGPHHRVYFLSEASAMDRGEPNHHLGTTRLFVSTSGGETWTSSLETGWADWSTSSVSSRTGELITFYQHSATSHDPRSPAGTIGILVFDAEGKHVSGPFLNQDLEEQGYRGVYPFHAFSFTDGTVGALYYGRKQAKVDLGLVRFLETSQPVASRIASLDAGDPCSSGLADVGMAYDATRDRVAAIYRSTVDGACKVSLAISADKGGSWTKQVIRMGDLLSEGFNRPSIAFNSKGELGVAWLTHGGAWRFGMIHEGPSLCCTMDVWKAQSPYLPTEDSLWTVMEDSPISRGISSPGPSTINVTVRSLSGRIWRSDGLIAIDEDFFAAGLGVDKSGQELYAAWIDEAHTDQSAPQVSNHGDTLHEVTNQVQLVFGGSQSFDHTTGILELDLRLINDGDLPIWTPIHLVAEGVGSSGCKVTPWNAGSDNSPAGAIWDLSGDVTGDRIPARSAMFNAVRLKFRVEMAGCFSPTSELLKLKVRVFARTSVEEGERPP